jgi:hypothetical protein
MRLKSPARRSAHTQDPRVHSIGSPYADPLAGNLGLPRHVVLVPDAVRLARIACCTVAGKQWWFCLR